MGFVIDWGVSITRTASTPLSFKTISVAFATRLDGASPNTSTGFSFAANGGRFFESSFTVSSENFESVPFSSTNISVAITPGPPAFVTIARFEPFGILFLPINSVTSKISPIS